MAEVGHGHGPDDATHRGWSPLTTLVIGVVASITLGALAGLLGYGIISLFISVHGVYAWCVFAIISIMSGGSLFDSGKDDHNVVPTGFEGVPSFLGSRLRLFTLSEGVHWIPPGFGVTPVDMRIDATKKVCVSGLTVDGVRVETETLLQLRTKDVYGVLSVESPIKSITGISEASVRTVLSGVDVDTVLKSSTKDAIQQAILDAINEHEAQIPVDVMKVFEPEIKLPPALEEDRANKLREIAQREAEKVEIDGIRQRLSELTGKPVDEIKMSEEYASELLQSERGKMQRSGVIHRFEGLQGVAEVIGNAIGKALGGKKD